MLAGSGLDAGLFIGRDGVIIRAQGGDLPNGWHIDQALGQPFP